MSVHVVGMEDLYFPHYLGGFLYLEDAILTHFIIMDMVLITVCTCEQ